MIKFFELTGKTAFITGASSGLGEQFAKKLKNAQAIQMDVANQNSVKSTFEILEQTGDKLDICINNAGISKLTLIFEDDPEKDFENQMQTNVAGVWYVTKAVARHMKNHTIHGSIMNITSINGSSIPAREYSAYSISKAAVIHLTKALVGELSPYKIRVNCISPGYFKTPMNKTDIDKVIPYIPCENIANPSDLDGLILYLASNKASRYVTGSHFTIDGGMSWGGKL